MAPPGNQAANGENKLQPVAMGDPSLLDYVVGSVRFQPLTYKCSMIMPVLKIMYEIYFFCNEKGL